jgi:hypothetical protein
MEKICTKCKIYKNIESFSKRSGKANLYKSHCKECYNLYYKNKQKLSQENFNIENLNIKFYKKCIKCNLSKISFDFVIDKSKKDGRNSCCKKCRKYFSKEKRKINKEYINQNKKWKLENKARYRKQQTQYENNKRHTDIKFRLRKTLRTRISEYLRKKHIAKTTSLIKLVGCTQDQLRQYLESKFQPGMNWNNYGQFGWHIDHIIPLSSFDLTNPGELAKACHYTNLQPLWWQDNIEKSNKIL